MRQPFRSSFCKFRYFRCNCCRNCLSQLFLSQIIDYMYVFRYVTDLSVSFVLFSSFLRWRLAWTIQRPPYFHTYRRLLWLPGYLRTRECEEYGNQLTRTLFFFFIWELTFVKGVGLWVWPVLCSGCAAVSPVVTSVCSLTQHHVPRSPWSWSCWKPTRDHRGHRDNGNDQLLMRFYAWYRKVKWRAKTTYLACLGVTRIRTCLSKCLLNATSKVSFQLSLNADWLNKLTKACKLIRSGLTFERGVVTCKEGHL